LLAGGRAAGLPLRLARVMPVQGNSAKENGVANYCPDAVEKFDLDENFTDAPRASVRPEDQVRWFLCQGEAGISQPRLHGVHRALSAPCDRS
jgi:hypothetical protein